jgi:hypothetical protein
LAEEYAQQLRLSAAAGTRLPEAVGSSSMVTAAPAGQQQVGARDAHAGCWLGCELHASTAGQVLLPALFISRCMRASSMTSHAPRVDHTCPMRDIRPSASTTATPNWPPCFPHPAVAGHHGCVQEHAAGAKDCHRQGGMAMISPACHEMMQAIKLASAPDLAQRTAAEAEAKVRGRADCCWAGGAGACLA